MSLLTIIALLALPLLSSAVSSDELSFPMIAAYGAGGPGAQNTTGQFTIKLQRAGDGIPLTPIVCKTANYDACYNFSNTEPVDQPLKVLTSQTLIMTADYKFPGSPIKTYKDQTPSSFQGKVCYSLVSAVDRKWRKKNKPYPGITENCLFNFPKTDVPANLNVTYVTVMELIEEDKMPTATFFAMLWIKCSETDEVCAFESTENKLFFQTEVYDTVTSEMIIVSIVFSVASILIFICFFSFDYFYYKKTGKGFYI
eukprot:gene3618-13703_t